MPPSAETIASRPRCSASTDAAASGVTSSASSRGTGGILIASAYELAATASASSRSRSLPSARPAACLACSAARVATFFAVSASSRAAAPARANSASTSTIGRVITACTALLRSPGTAAVTVYRHNGSRHPGRTSTSTRPPATAASTASAVVPAMPASVWGNAAAGNGGSRTRRDSGAGGGSVSAGRARANTSAAPCPAARKSSAPTFSAPSAAKITHSTLAPFALRVARQRKQLPLDRRFDHDIRVERDQRAATRPHDVEQIGQRDAAGTPRGHPEQPDRGQARRGERVDLAGALGDDERRPGVVQRAQGQLGHVDHHPGSGRRLVLDRTAVDLPRLIRPVLVQSDPAGGVANRNEQPGHAALRIGEAKIAQALPGVHRDVTALARHRRVDRRVGEQPLVLREEPQA